MRHLYEQFGFQQIGCNNEAKSIIYRLTDFEYRGSYNIQKIEE